MCIELAQLHSRAVDAAKTGDRIVIKEYMKVDSWPSYMGKKDCKQYESTSVLVSASHLLFNIDKGKLYSQVLESLKDLNKPSTVGIQIDQDLLIPGREPYLKEARKLLKKYNSEIKQAQEILDEEERAVIMDQIRKKYEYSCSWLLLIFPEISSLQPQTTQNSYAKQVLGNLAIKTEIN